MTTNLKLELFKACIFMLLGAFLCARFSPVPKPIEIKQEQASKCKATITKRQNADGSHDEITEFLAESKQSQIVDVKKSKKHSVKLFKDKLGYSYKVYEGSIDLAPLVLLSKDKAELGLEVNF